MNISKDSNQLSVVSKHRLNSGHEFDWNKAIILDNKTYFYKRLISECLYIKLNSDTINIASDTDLLSPVYGPIIQKLSLTDSS